MIFKIKKFLYFLFVDLVRWRPFILRSTHEKIVKEINEANQQMYDHYWKKQTFDTIKKRYKDE